MLLLTMSPEDGDDRPLPCLPNEVLEMRETDVSLGAEDGLHLDMGAVEVVLVVVAKFVIVGFFF